MEIGFNIKNTDFLEGNIINLNFFYNYYIDKNIFELNAINIYIEHRNLFDKLNNNLVEDFYSKLYSDFKKMDHTEIDFNKIIYLFVLIFRILKNLKKITLINNDLKIENFDISQYEKQLIIRAGCIELMIVNIFENLDYSLIKTVIKEIKENLDNLEYFYENKTKKSCWITTFHTYQDYKNYLISFITNTGFYFNKNEQCDEIFSMLKNFTINYKNAIINSDYNYYWPFLSCFMLNILNEKKLFKPIIDFMPLDRKSFLKIVDNKNICFLTPFSKLINEIYETKQIYNLRKISEENFKNINLETIESFLTTYPNKVHNNFDETMDYYKTKIDEKFKEKKFDIFICSVGCYGIILANYVYNKYNITSLSLGHDINQYFGIISNKDLRKISKQTGVIENYDRTFLEEFNIENIRFSDLKKRYVNIDKIDNNNYGFDFFLE